MRKLTIISFLCAISISGLFALDNASIEQSYVDNGRTIVQEKMTVVAPRDIVVSPMPVRIIPGKLIKIQNKDKVVSYDIFKPLLRVGVKSSIMTIIAQK